MSSSSDRIPAPPATFSKPEELFDYYLAFVNFEESRRQTIREYRLDRMHRLLAFFGNPERQLRCVHLAGSKGKGSTALFIARALEALGYRTGLYTSPHVSSFKERISLAGSFFPDEAYLRAGRKVAQAIPQFALQEREGSALPTTFELLTLTAFLLFREEGCSWAVVETGIGGRLDATNVITPELSVITPIELEHTDLLGTSIEEIAREKAGIIKPEVPVVLGYQRPQAAAVLRAAAAEREAPMKELSGECAQLAGELHQDGSEVRISWRDGRKDEFSIPMLGEVQAENAALALLSLRQLLRPAEPAWQRVLAAYTRTSLPGRMELIAPGPPPLICDGAHTPASLGRLLGALRRIYPERPPVLIFGAVLGKSWREMAELLAQYAAAAVVSTPGSFKKSDPAALHRICLEAGIDASLKPEPAEALAEARRIASVSQPVVVTGSFYMVAEIRALIARTEGLPGAPADATQGAGSSG